MPGKGEKAVFDPMEFLTTFNGGRTISKYQADQQVFSQGDMADAVFYIQTGRSKSPLSLSRVRKLSSRSLGRTPSSVKDASPDRSSAWGQPWQ